MWPNFDRLDSGSHGQIIGTWMAQRNCWRGRGDWWGMGKYRWSWFGYESEHWMSSHTIGASWEAIPRDGDPWREIRIGLSKHGIGRPHDPGSRGARTVRRAQFQLPPATPEIQKHQWAPILSLMFTIWSTRMVSCLTCLYWTFCIPLRTCYPTSRPGLSTIETMERINCGEPVKQVATDPCK
jgi:hypothetical protein